MSRAFHVGRYDRGLGEVEAGPAGEGLIARVATSLALEVMVRGIGVALPFLDDVVDDGDDRCAKLLDNARSAGRGTVSDGAEARKD